MVGEEEEGERGYVGDGKQSSGKQSSGKLGGEPECGGIDKE